MTLATKVLGLRRRVATRIQPSDPTPVAAPPAPAPVNGVVERVTPRLAAGWVAVPPTAPPTRVELWVNDIHVASTYATPDASMSSVGSAARKKERVRAGRGRRATYAWQTTPVPGPAEDRRNARGQIRTFSFRMIDLWEYVTPRSRITVRVDGRRLPITGHGMYVAPPQRGQYPLADLRQKLAEGYVLSQWGRIQLSKQHDVEWQRKVLSLYTQVSEILRRTYGYDPFFIYGTLLGAVREHGYIGHDIDFDAAYLSRHTDGRQAAAELAEVGLALVDAGLGVDCHKTALHVTDPNDPENRIDLFHLYFDDEGILRFPFGVAGTVDFTRDHWTGTEEIDWPQGRGVIPGSAEHLVRVMYGDDWRRPKPGFNWDLDRTAHAPAGWLTQEERTKVYWADFYAHHHYTEGSTFFRFVAGWPDVPHRLVDIGCGEGRDSCAFGAADWRVLGVDQSAVGIERAQKRASEQSLADHVDFRVCDVADVADLGRVLDEARGGDDQRDSVTFYLRFFLHAIDEQTQGRLLDAIDAHVHPGDVFAAEFRTDKDKAIKKVHGNHYRRYQNAETFREGLAARGWAIKHFEESQGLSVYEGEDPWLCRVVATR